MTQKKWALIALMIWSSMATLPGLAYEKPKSDESNVTTNKWHVTQNRFEFSLYPYDLTIRNYFSQNDYGIHAGVGYHIFDWLAVEAFGGYVFLNGDTRPTNFIKQISTVKDFELSSLWRTRWFTGGNVLWAPFYGKLSLMSEVESAYQFYVLLGAGVEGIERPDADLNMVHKTRFAGFVGAGVRFFITPSIAFRTEIRESMGANTILPNGGESHFEASTWCQLGLSIFL